MSSKTEKNLKKAIVILSALLLVSVCLLIGILIYYERIAPSVITDQKITTRETGTEASVSISERKVNIVAAPEGTVNDGGGPWKSSDVSVLRLYRGQSFDDTAFAVNEMFPGDEFAKNYLVQVSHKGTVTLHFKAKVFPSADPVGERLEEVLMCKVEVGDQFLYRGLMRDMPTSVTYKTVNAQTATTTEVPYKITVYLDGPNVGNAHMNKNLSADFQWWVEEKQKEDPKEDYDGSIDADDDYVKKPSKEYKDEPGDLNVKGEWEEKEEEEDNFGLLVLPMTGDETNWVIYAVACVGSFLILLLLVRKRKEENYD